MKTFLFAALFFFFTSTLFAQYIPFPMSNARWSIAMDAAYDPDAPYSSEHYGFYYELSGDTILNGLVYQKLIEKQTWWKYWYSQPTPPESYFESGNYSDAYTPILIGALRQDTAAQKVYFKTFNGYWGIPINQDVLLFDFDVEVGDTIFQVGNAHVIERIDSVQFNDAVYRRRYHLKNPWPEFVFIEGIGTNASLFEGLRAPFVEGHFYQLNCLTIDNEYIIGNGIYQCDSIDVVVPVVEIDSKTQLSIYPNPFGNFLQIELSNYSKDWTLELHNTLGQKLIENSSIPNGHLKLSTSAFDPGIYVLSIFNGKQLMTTQSIVKLP